MTGSSCSLSRDGPTSIRLQLKTGPPMKRYVTSSEQRVVGSVRVKVCLAQKYPISNFSKRNRAALMSSVVGTKCKVLPHVFSTCCICESSLSEFQKRVYHTIAQIEKGQVTTYGDLAKTLDSAPRAVGQALKRSATRTCTERFLKCTTRNPFNSETYIPRVPCHRVISKNCTLGGGRYPQE
jgi:hypothetical protein